MFNLVDKKHRSHFYHGLLERRRAIWIRCQNADSYFCEHFGEYFDRSCSCGIDEENLTYAQTLGSGLNSYASHHEATL
jgi:hypothetical protein